MQLYFRSQFSSGGSENARERIHRLVVSSLGGIAVDGGGSVWVTSNGNNSVTVLPGSRCAGRSHGHCGRE
jgi:hypothetical protein